ncbi:hypothetical protein ACPPVO_35970 [Dactylosporangium sp. McL0621]|uniref:hypothetical protein n=1 Tax=Dactylosporangium sp. McL0621 TaxID=3415678 RepID=UPI003CF5212B
MTYSRRQLYELLQQHGLPVLPARRVTGGGQLLTAATELGYPDIAVTVVLDDVFEDPGAWTLTPHADIITPGRRIPLAVLAALLDDERPMRDLGGGVAATGVVVRPALETVNQYHPMSYPGQCAVDLCRRRRAAAGRPGPPHPDRGRG